jgi:hypothetical protein
MRKTRLSLLGLFLMSGLVAAAPVSVGDFSFEGNSLNPAGWNDNLDPEWKETGGPNNGNGFEEYITGFVADGNDHLGMQPGHDVWQDLGVVYQPNTRYTLTVAVGNRSGSTSGGNQSQYLLADSTGVVYATGILDASTLAGQTFADAPALVFDTPNAPGAVGKTVRVLLRARGNGRSHFDNIRVDAQSLIPPGAAVVENLAATDVTTTTVTLGGEVTDVGDGAPAITIFWGTSDGGVNPVSWDDSVNLAGTHSGMFSAGVTGLSPGTTYHFTARATNSAGESWSLAGGEFETLPLPPVVTHLPAGNVRPTGADLGVTVTGAGLATLTVYYGTADGGSDAGAWASSVVQGAAAGTVTVPLTGLSTATTYYFRAFAENEGGETWALESGQFTTLTVSLPTVENRNADGLTGTTANLRGEVVDEGNDTPVVTIFYGAADGGTTPGAWSGSVAVGAQAGNFSGFVTGLSPATTYYFRSRATNAAGTVWAAETATFTTTTAIPNTAVIHEIHYNPEGRVNLEEFIELRNPGDSVLDLSGWTLSDAVSYTFPGGTTLAPGGYLIVAEAPAVILSRYGKTALGPWVGKLNSTGERIDLRDGGGVLRDRVTYGVGFPWPTGANGGGNSMELIHPGLDNDLGGSWRSSGGAGSGPVTYIASQEGGWRYRKGTSEASNPVTNWRNVAFGDSSWLIGQTGIGYGDPGINTTLGDMRRNNFQGIPGYASVYFRKSFVIPVGEVPEQLRLRIRIDDGCVIWINGVEVDRRYVASGQLAFNYLAPANHDNDNWDEVVINNADVFLVGGTNVVAIHGFNTTLNSGDFSMDFELSSLGSEANPAPTPGAANSAAKLVNLVPPQIRQVSHVPENPLPNVPVTVSARITDPDGMGAVSLAYQIVDAGSYIRRTDAAYETTWTTVAMNDAGSNGDLVAGDSIFSVQLPANVQVNRRLVRYRITFADSLGNSQRVPYADDEQPNFAYFVYQGVPSWSGAIRPSSFNGFPATPVVTYSSNLLESLPPFHLIANVTDVENSQYNGSFANTRFRGTVVHRGVIHDHIEFRVRGIGSTYQSGKNKWNVYFNRARDFQAYDNHNRPYREKWNNLLINANASPWASVHRGSGGIEEAVSHRIYQIAGMAAMNTQFMHLRVIDGAAEVGATQYEGDMWGLYLGLEPTEGNFLDERDLPDGSLYSIEGNGGDKKHQGSTHPVDSSDWTAFANGMAQGGQTEQWYRDNVDLPSLYTFLGLNRLIGNVDVRPGDNYRFYHRSSDDRWVIIPYDLDMQFIAAHHWGGGMDGVVVAGAPNVIRAISRHPNLAREYRNRCRELISLMASDGSADGGQVGQLIREYANFIHPAGETVTWANLDAAMWNLHPRTQGGGGNSGQSSHKGNFYRANYLDGPRGGLGGTVSTSSYIRTLVDLDGDGFSTHEGMMQWFTNYATNTWPGGTWNRKAMSGIGNGVDSDPNRQLGYGFKYLEFEALNGGWIDANVNPPAAPVLDFPSKPVLTATGDGAFPVTDLTFESSGFADAQGAGDFAAWQWRVARISAAGMPGHDAAGPSIYEMNAVMESGELSGAPGEFAIPLGVVEPGLTYRVRVRHKDVAGNWSYWSEPVEFGATEAPQRDLVHYWNFNSVPVLGTSYTEGGATLAVSGTGTVVADSGQNFTGENAWNGDLTGNHFRLNNPLGATVNLAVPTTGYRDVIVRYETRRSGQGAGLQVVSYTVNGTDYLPFAEIEVVDGVPVVQNLDFRGVSGVDHNPDFAIRITFQQGAGGLAGNNRFDNLTVEGEALPVAPVTLDGLAVVYDGAEKEVLVTTDPPGLAVEITYNGSPTVPTAAGSYAVVATVNDDEYVGSAVGTLVIGKATAGITFDGLGAVYDGTEKEVTVTTDPLGLVVEVSYDGMPTAPVDAGVYSVVATVVDDNYEGEEMLTLEIAKATAVVTLGDLAAVYDGLEKEVSVTTDPLGLLVEVTYDGLSTAPTEAGSYAVVATVVDDNREGTVSGTLVIGKGTAVVTLGDLAVVYDGAEKDVSVTTDPLGLAVEVTYDGLSTAPTEAGSYAVVATVVDDNREGTASGTLVIGKAAAVVTLGDLAAVYDGLEKEASVTTDPLDLAVEVTYDGLSTVPTEVGSYAVVATVVDDNHEGSASGTLVIEAAVAGYAEWRTEHFPDPGDFANDAISGPFASAAGDGVANIVRYSMDLGPFDGVGGKMPKIALTPGGPVLLFHHDAAKEDLRWLVKTSPDLVDWTTVTWDFEVHGAPGAHGDPWFNASIALPETFGGNPATELFHRLEIGVAAGN